MTAEDTASVYAITIRTAESLLREASTLDPELAHETNRVMVAKLFDIRDRAAQPGPDEDAEWEKQRGLQIELCDFRDQRTAARIAREQAEKARHFADTTRQNIRAAEIAELWRRLPPHVQDELIAEQRRSERVGA
jgi:hypothetical protein